jgi:hypothetical protein
LCNSCTKDEGEWPFGVGFQERASNHSKLLRTKAVVVSVGAKFRGLPEPVGIKKTNASEPLMERRETNNVVKTRDWIYFWDKLARHLVTGQAAAGVEEA